MKNIINTFLLSFLIIGLSQAQKIDNAFFNDVNTFLSSHVSNGLVDYGQAKGNSQLSDLISTIEKADLSGSDEQTKKAFYINAYNLNVINQITKSYPTKSPMDITGFFDSKKVTVAGKKQTLNNLEKNYMLKPFGDPRFHFVLVCGALGCPPITDFAYMPGQLDRQMDQQTKIALNNTSFLKVNGNEVQLSQIFKWYTSDFGGSRGTIIEFINKYRKSLISKTSKVSYYQYDWTLNDSSKKKANTESVEGANASRYIVSSTIAKGTFEIKLFNNLYSQQTGSEGNLTDRSSFFTTSISALYGLNNRFNIGINARVRKVRNQSLPSSAFDVFGADGNGSSRSGVTAIGPQIRYAPIPSWENFSIQSSFVFAIGDQLSGSDSQPYIDWDGPTWNTQFFNDIPIGTNFSLFTELDLLIEDIGNSNRISTPATLILSYNPNSKTTLYTIGGFSPFWQTEFDYFVQVGTGAKYQFTPKLELELLYTKFTNKFLIDTDGQADTFNLGLRFNI